MKKLKTLFVRKMIPNKKTECYTKYPCGVNLLGLVDSEAGVGEACRIVDRMLKFTTWPHVVNRYADAHTQNMDTNRIEICETNPYSINLIRINADLLIAQTPALRINGYFKNRYNIGFWDWELDEFPEEWHGAFNIVNEIWVSSTFIQGSLSKVSNIPVVRMPLSIKIKNQPPSFNRLHFKLPENVFVYLFVFDYASISARKNPEGLVRAFQKAFKESDDVLLVLKSSRGDVYPEDYHFLKSCIHQKNIILIDAVMKREESDALIQISDCYVSLHRSEGFGLTIAEAMSFAKPVIATAYSGNLDFMAPGTCYPVEYELIQIEKEVGPFKKGNHWAEPNIDHAAAHMRFVYENQEDARETGRRACDFITKNFSPEVVAQTYQKRLDVIARFTGMK